MRLLIEGVVLLLMSLSGFNSSGLPTGRQPFFETFNITIYMKPPAPIPTYTIGYGNRLIEEFINENIAVMPIDEMVSNLRKRRLLNG